MIPWAALKALPWKWIAAGVLGLALVLTGVRINAWRHAYLELQDVQAALEAERDCAEGTECAKRAAEATEKAQAATTEAVASYESELESLRNRPPVPARVIRVCPAASGDVRHAAAPSGTDGTGPASGVIHGPVEFDPRPLFDLAREADQLAARLRALQDYSRAVSAPPP